jgi:hypothetical protein
MSRHYLAYPNYRPALIAPDQPSPIGGTWRPAKYTEIGGQIHFGLACEQVGPTFNGHRCRGFRFPSGHLADVLAARVAWVDEVAE